MKDFAQMVADGKNTVKKSFSATLNCGETSFLATVEALNLQVDPEMVYVSSPLGGGFGERAEITECNCGLIVGTMMAMGLIYWRKRIKEGGSFMSLDDRNGMTRLSNLWLTKFMIEAGAAGCPEIVGSLPYLGDEHRRKCWKLGQNMIEIFLNFLKDNNLI